MPHIEQETTKGIRSRIQKYKVCPVEDWPNDTDQRTTWLYQSKEEGAKRFTATLQEIAVITERLDAGIGLGGIANHPLTKLFSDRTRADREVDRIVEFQKATFNVDASPLDTYKNQTSRFVLSCERCPECEKPTIPASKATFQTCRHIGIERRSEKRRRPLEEIKRCVEELGFTLLEAADYEGKHSLITLKCRYGCVFQKRAGYIQPNDVWGCPGCTNSVGAKLALSIIEYVVEAGCIFEACPDFLSAQSLGRTHPLYLDGLFETARGAFAVEYQGRQHLEKRGDLQSDADFDGQRDRDFIKAEACRKAGMPLLYIEDLRFKKLDLSERITYLRDLFVEQSHSLPVDPDALESRFRKLASNRELQLSLLKAVNADQSRIQKLEADLAQTGRSHLKVLSWDAVKRTFAMYCSVHDHSFSVIDSNIFSSRLGKSGTDCFWCGKERMAKAARLKDEELVERARKRGYRIISPLSDYKNQGSVLIFESIASPRKIRRTRMDRL